MIIPRSVWVGLVAVALLPSCGSVNRDEIDRDAFFVDARVRQTIDGEVDHEGTYAELGWNSVHGETNGLDYSIGRASLGFGLDGKLGEKGWIGIVGGFALLIPDFDSTTEAIESENTGGPWIAIQGGWMLTPWLEACARTDLGLYFPDVNTMFGVEAGARFHVADHTAFFVGWRYAAYEINDLDTFLSFDELELDASGLIVGLELSF